MHPTLFTINGLAFHSYGIAMAAGFLAAVLLTVRSAERQGFSVNRVLDLSFWILVSAIGGARLLYVITEAGPYLARCVGGDGETPRTLGQVLGDCSRPLHLWEGGLVYLGGFVCAVLTVAWYARRHKLGVLRTWDLLIPVVALGHGIGRLGCFCAGCCYGKVTAFAGLGLAFPPASVIYKELVAGGLLAASATATPPVFPTQLGEAFAELGLYFVLLVVRRRKRFHGQALLTYLVVYPVVRFLLEIVRADPDRHFIFALTTPPLSRLLGLPPGDPTFLSTSQLISLLLLAAAAILQQLIRRNRTAAAGSNPGG